MFGRYSTPLRRKVPSSRRRVARSPRSLTIGHMDSFEWLAKPETRLLIRGRLSV